MVIPSSSTIFMPHGWGSWIPTTERTHSLSQLAKASGDRDRWTRATRALYLCFPGVRSRIVRTTSMFSCRSLKCFTWLSYSTEACLLEPVGFPVVQHFLLDLGWEGCIEPCFHGDFRAIPGGRPGHIKGSRSSGAPGTLLHVIARSESLGASLDVLDDSAALRVAPGGPRMDHFAQIEDVHVVVHDKNLGEVGATAGQSIQNLLGYLPASPADSD